MKDLYKYAIRVKTAAEKKTACELLSKLSGIPIYSGTNFEYLDGYDKYGIAGDNSCICGTNRNGTTIVDYADIPKMLLEIFGDVPVQVVLNSDYTAIVSKDGVTVGC